MWEAVRHRGDEWPVQLMVPRSDVAVVAVVRKSGETNVESTCAHDLQWLMLNGQAPLGSIPHPPSL